MKLDAQKPGDDKKVTPPAPPQHLRLRREKWDAIHAETLRKFAKTFKALRDAGD